MSDHARIYLQPEGCAMSDCAVCPADAECHYVFKPCDCVHQRKFMSADERKAYDLAQTPPVCLGARK